jgi:hypothetical protein
VEHNDSGRVTVLLVDANFHAGGLCTFPQLCEVAESFSRAPRERNARWRGVKNVKPGLADNRQAQRTFERSFTCLFEIDCTQNSGKPRHAASSIESAFRRRIGTGYASTEPR